MVLRDSPSRPRWLAPAVAALVLLAAATPEPVLVIGLLLAGMTAYKLVRRVRPRSMPDAAVVRPASTG
jgi:hypothetical protein